MFSRIQSVHFVGVCGTAMASAAAAMKEKGVRVTGSDQNVYPPMSTFLADRQIEVISGYAEQNLARKPDLVVIGNAISRGNPEAEYVLDHRLPYCSLPELLKHFFIRGKRSVVVSGTHGKTTTTSLLTWVFEHNGLNPSYPIGGTPVRSSGRVSSAAQPHSLSAGPFGLSVLPLFFCIPGDKGGHVVMIFHFRVGELADQPMEGVHFRWSSTIRYFLQLKVVVFVDPKFRHTL